MQWNTVREARIADLLDAHARVGGTGQGRRWRTEQLNWALVLRVAGEFQGYCRDLHDEAADVVAVDLSGLNWTLQQALRLAATNGRRLDIGNPTLETLIKDFRRVGIANIWTLLQAAKPGPAVKWKTTLKALMDARNGIAHADPNGIKDAEAAGFPLSRLDTVKRFRASMHGLALAMDDVVADTLQQLLQRSTRPW